MVDQNNRPRPMGDIQPRRSMDMVRPGGTQPMPQRPTPRPMPRPVDPAPVHPSPIQRPQPLPQRPIAPAQRPMPRPAQYAQAPQQYAQAPQQYTQSPNQPATKQTKATRPPKVRKARPIWRGFLQVLVSLLVIVGVAAVIVLLYLKYYS